MPINCFSHGKILLAIVGFLLTTTMASAEIIVPNIFCDHMVLQQGQPNKIWGRADAGEKVVVKIAGQSHSIVADAAGDWSLMLEPLAVGGPYELVLAGSNEIRINDVLVGEVWVCSGQSNMEWRVNNSEEADLTKLTANYPQIRMIKYKRRASQKPIWSHENSSWEVCSPKTVGGCSAVAYYFGRQLHLSTQVPVGLVINSWGGSAIDAWIDRDRLEATEDYQPTLVNFEASSKELSLLKQIKKPSQEEQKRYQSLKRKAAENKLPANLYNGVLKSHLGYGMKGVIWYQGESNSERAYQYRYLFPMMINNWRDEWKQGDFPFYWVQLADYRAEQTEPSESDWAELREAQTMALKLPNTGQAVIVDLGEGKDIHPRNKLTVANRLSRLALANDYGFDIPHESPRYSSMENNGSSITLTFDHIHNGWRPFDTKQIVGFAIAGADKKFYWADAKILKDNKIMVSSSKVAQPVAVRYAWADNPICNLYDRADLPLTPFRTDDWPGLTINKR